MKMAVENLYLCVILVLSFFAFVLVHALHGNHKLCVYLHCYCTLFVFLFVFLWVFVNFLFEFVFVSHFHKDMFISPVDAVHGDHNLVEAVANIRPVRHRLRYLDYVLLILRLYLHHT